MTSSSEARVPHDPKDLRRCVRLIKGATFDLSDLNVADRLEVWADDMEREDETDPFGAGMEAGHKDLLVMNEDRRQRARTFLADFFDGDFNFADRIIGALHHEGFEIVTTDAVYRAPKIDSQRLAPLEAAVLDAAKKTYATRDHFTGRPSMAAMAELERAVRALQEATE